MSKKRKVIWDNEARSYLRQAIAYIRKDSPQNADNVKKDILASVRSLTSYPEKQYAPDKFRKNNDGSYRAYEIHHFRISYFISDEVIRIVRIRHTGMEPKGY